MPKSRMNRALMRKVADKLDSLRGKRRLLWNQLYFITQTECGTAHCIGGWAIVIDGTYLRELRCWYESYPDSAFDLWNTARRVLGLTPRQSNKLFGLDFMRGSTPQEVAERLREFAREGRVEV